MKFKGTKERKMAGKILKRKKERKKEYYFCVIGRRKETVKL